MSTLVLCFRCRFLESKLGAGECIISPNDQAALLQLLSQAEKDYCMTNDCVHELDKDRLAVLENRMKAGPLAPSHLAVLQLLGRAEVGVLSNFKHYERASAC